jgi:hypothetical protein
VATLVKRATASSSVASCGGDSRLLVGSAGAALHEAFESDRVELKLAQVAAHVRPDTDRPLQPARAGESAPISDRHQVGDDGTATCKLWARVLLRGHDKVGAQDFRSVAVAG